MLYQAPCVERSETSINCPKSKHSSIKALLSKSYRLNTQTHFSSNKICLNASAWWKLWVPSETSDNSRKPSRLKNIRTLKTIWSCRHTMTESKDIKSKLEKYGKSRREGYRRTPVRDLASTSTRVTINIKTHSKGKDKVVHLVRRLACLAIQPSMTETWQ